MIPRPNGSISKDERVEGVHLHITNAISVIGYCARGRPRRGTEGAFTAVVGVPHAARAALPRRAWLWMRGRPLDPKFSMANL